MSDKPNQPMEVSGALRVILALACLVVVVAGLRAANTIVVPFLLAIFISIICAPPLFWMQQKRVPKWLALLIILVVVVGATLLLGLIVGRSVASFTQSLPEYQERLADRSAPLLEWLEKRGVDVPRAQLREQLNLGRAMQFAGAFLSGLSGVLANTFLILLTVVFILLEAADLPGKIRSAFPTSSDPLSGFADFMGNVKRYLVIKTGVSAITGACAFLLCLVMRLDYPLLWGVLAFLLNYVPSIGSIIAAAPPVLLALVLLGPVPAAVVAGGYVVINVMFGSLLEPRMLGRGLGMSTLVVFLSLVFWGWVLGPVGMVLSVPLTMVVKIALANSEDTRWLSVLLGAGEK